MNEISIKYPVVSYLIPLPFLMLLMGASYWGGFMRDEHPGLLIQIMVIAVCSLCIFLMVQFIRKAMNPPEVMVVTTLGFEYNPAGVSTGFVSWSDVEKVEDVVVMTTNASINGRPEPALGVWLKDPESYFQKWNLALRKLMQANQKMYGATILIQPSSLGKDYGRVREAMLAGANSHRHVE